LAAIILASLGTARSKGNDSKVEEQLHNMQEAAELYNNNNKFSYTGMCGVASTDTSGLYSLEQASAWPNGSVPTCRVTTSSYIIYETLSSNTSEQWCVDSNGRAALETSAISTTATACP
jgi:hypothetical protein